MPIYDFKCTKCEALSEKLVKLGTETIECPECGSEAKRTVQQGTPSNFILKGTGWYATDFSGK